MVLDRNQIIGFIDMNRTDDDSFDSLDRNPLMIRWQGMIFCEMNFQQIVFFGIKITLWTF